MDNRFSRHRPGKLDEQADKTGREAIEEARMVLPGIQALFRISVDCGFQRALQRAYRAHPLQRHGPRNDCHRAYYDPRRL